MLLDYEQITVWLDFNNKHYCFRIVRDHLGSKDFHKNNNDKEITNCKIEQRQLIKCVIYTKNIILIKKQYLEKKN